MSCKEISYKECDASLDNVKIKGTTSGTGSITVARYFSGYMCYVRPDTLTMTISEAKEVALKMLEVIEELE